MFKSLYLLAFFNFVTLLAPPCDAAEGKLTFCVEETEFPPFNYFVRQGNAKTTELAGYDIDVLKRVFEVGSYEVVSLPWRRCLVSLTTGAVDGALSASMNEQRQRDYISSEPYYYLTPGYFFLASTKDAPTEVASAEELRSAGTVCGLGDHNYSHFGLASGTDVVRTASYKQLSEVLSAGRCRFYLDRLELLPAKLALMPNQPFPPLGKGPIIGAPSEPFYLLISPQSPKREWLKRHFDEQINKLRNQGELARILEINQEKLQQPQP
ncbi:ABC transporter substrate-binding protein [Shewanella sp. JM162201]|uniref:ABC transporter substrate-binding protein n=1 Tax=Shewanella jiangmenensis TaxID=2837387 RepID=A0ABS5V4M9_9GAMM|nr:ABC transporter substrate-binding protein [Shewanella jiangmenensis]MBT1445416.1 ABC transporter substrate-binding protein [Shewanella jiangmenensis]